MRQLLTHTAGLSNPLPLRWTHPADAEPPDPQVLLARLLTRRHAFNHPVGKVARYSNVGYLAAGEIISAAAGMPFTDYVHHSVLRPMGMDHTGFRYRVDTDRATGYIRAPRITDPLLRRLLPDGIAGDRNASFLALNPFYVDGPAYGGLIGDVLDASRFLRMHLNDGELDGNLVLAPRTARGMRRLEHPGKPFDHGIGWFRRPTNDAGDWVEQPTDPGADPATGNRTTSARRRGTRADRNGRPNRRRPLAGHPARPTRPAISTDSAQPRAARPRPPPSTPLRADRRDHQAALQRYTCAVATIQIRELPEDAYEMIRRRARASGQSIQAYMREQIIEFASRRTKVEALAAVESALAAEDSPGSSLAQIVADLSDARR